MSNVRLPTDVEVEAALPATTFAVRVDETSLSAQPNLIHGCSLRSSEGLRAAT